MTPEEREDFLIENRKLVASWDKPIDEYYDWQFDIYDDGEKIYLEYGRRKKYDGSADLDEIIILNWKDA